MLKATFSCFQGLSSAAETRLWRKGCLDWNMFHHLLPGVLSRGKSESVQNQIKVAEAALEAGLADYFLNRLPGSDSIRILNDFRSRGAFLDIETTGLAKDDCITTIAVLMNGRLTVFTRGVDLERFLAVIPRISLMLTYNGTRFDLPFLRRCFGIDLPVPHLDLMPVLRTMGYVGGQKGCEKLAGITRRHSAGTDGAEAVRLWRQYKKNNSLDSLGRLIIYNAEDVAMLERLAVLAYNQSMSPYPITTRLQPSLAPAWTAENIHSPLFEN